MGDVTETIDVDRDVRTVYNQWTQFEEFPRFMEGVDRVQQIDDRHLHWEVDIVGVDREFDAEITEQTPDQRIAWRSRTGVDQGGVVTFHPLNDEQTRVTLQLTFEPEGLVEQAGDTLGLVAARVEGDLKRFKEFIESRGSETGAWRGEVDRDEPS
ncbi:MAG: SRPBCC family protein [Actinomycetes bacterium]